MDGLAELMDSPKHEIQTKDYHRYYHPLTADVKDATFVFFYSVVGKGGWKWLV